MTLICPQPICPRMMRPLADASPYDPSITGGGPLKLLFNRLRRDYRDQRPGIFFMQAMFVERSLGFSDNPTPLCGLRSGYIVQGHVVQGTGYLRDGTSKNFRPDLIGQGHIVMESIPAWFFLRVESTHPKFPYTLLYSLYQKEKKLWIDFMATFFSLCRR